MNYSRHDNSKGFGLVATLFLIVTLASAAAMMVSVGGVSNQNNLMALQSTRAYYAADSGLEWAIKRVVNNVNLCTAGSTTTLGTLTFTTGGLNGFISVVTCERSRHIENASTISVITITSIGKFATAGDASDFMRPDYVARELKSTVPVTEP